MQAGVFAAVPTVNDDDDPLLSDVWYTVIGFSELGLLVPELG